MCAWVYYELFLVKFSIHIGILPVTSGDPPDQQKLMQQQNKLKTKNSGMSKEVKRSWLWTEFKKY
jgi:hypothetical protein